MNPSNPLAMDSRKETNPVEEYVRIFANKIGAHLQLSYYSEMYVQQYVTAYLNDYPIPSLPPQGSGWASVKERLPEDGEYVIVFTKKPNSFYEKKSIEKDGLPEKAGYYFCVSPTNQISVALFDGAVFSKKGIYSEVAFYLVPASLDSPTVGEIKQWMENEAEYSNELHLAASAIDWFISKLTLPPSPVGDNK